MIHAQPQERAVLSRENAIVLPPQPPRTPVLADVHFALPCPGGRRSYRVFQARMRDLTIKALSHGRSLLPEAPRPGAQPARGSRVDRTGGTQLMASARKVDLWLPGIEKSNTHHASTAPRIIDSMWWIRISWSSATTSLSGPHNLKQVSTSVVGGCSAFGIRVPGVSLACTQIGAPGRPQAGGGEECDAEQGAESLTGHNGLERGNESGRLTCERHSQVGNA